jgi:hypothetical protein
MTGLVHVVITRFNLATAGREQGFRTTPGWLEGRFDLFECYCLPTMAVQTCRNFIWLVLFDEATPDWARRRIAQCRQLCAFTPVFTGHFDSAGWGRLVRDAIGDPVAGRLVVTSNLDNDDGLAADYIARVQDCALNAWRGQTMAINLSWGLVLSGRRLYLHYHRSCAFTNMVEADTPAIRTTSTIRHNDLPLLLPLVQIGGTPGWLQVVHGRNVSNKVRGKVIDKPSETAFPAAVLADVENPGWLEKAWDNGVIAPARALRDRIFILARRIVPADRASLR